MNLRSLLATAAIGAIASTHAAPELITNGSFELGTDPGAFSTVTATDSTTITGWTVSQGSVDYIGSYWVASEGLRSIDLAGNAPGTITQTGLATVANQKYKLSFDLAGNPDGAPTVKLAIVTADGHTFNESFTVPTGATHANMGWKTYDVYFTASGASSVSFAAANQAPGFFGPALDNVKLVAAPGPAGALVFGLGLLRRKRRSN